MTKPKVLVAEKVHPILIEDLTEAGFEVEDHSGIDANQLFNIIDQFTGLIVRSKVRVDRKLIDQAIQLKFIGRTGSGMELIDRDYAHQKSIKTYNSPEGNKDSVAEHTIGLILSTLHNICKANRELRSLKWTRMQNIGSELSYKTVGLIGFGNTGQAVAQRLQAFGCKILAYDKYKSGFESDYVKESELADIYKEADILSLHLPLNKETHHFFNNNFLKNFSKEIILINTSRGSVANTSDIINGLKQKELSAVALDVFENEDFKTLSKEDKDWMTWLSKQDNVILTPHIAGVSYESQYKLSSLLSSKIKADF